MDTILKNAVQSLQIGIEDFESADERRVLSSVRNVTAGTRYSDLGQGQRQRDAWLSPCEELPAPMPNLDRALAARPL